jgi:hypothetical protein
VFPTRAGAGFNDNAEDVTIMKTMRRWQCLGLAGIGLALVTSTGCQTNVAGMTLPSGHYLQHPPQYFAPSPAFPLQRELASMEAAAGPGAVAAGAAPLPPPAPVAPAAVPAQPPVLAPAPAPAPAP